VRIVLDSEQVAEHPLLGKGLRAASDAAPRARAEGHGADVDQTCVRALAHSVFTVSASGCGVRDRYASLFARFGNRHCACGPFESGGGACSQWSCCLALGAYLSPPEQKLDGTGLSRTRPQLHPTAGRTNGTSANVLPVWEPRGLVT
jgi:hypothetical protein